MKPLKQKLTRRSAVVGGVAFALQSSSALAAADPVITVHEDPNCGCCSGWVQHLQKSGFGANVFETRDLDAVKKRPGISDDLAACHTAEVAGYVVEGHVPAEALKRFLLEKPTASGLAVPGMPIGSPGMEGGTPELYDVIVFGPTGRKTFMRFLGKQFV
jgi:hypothetical protein